MIRFAVILSLLLSAFLSGRADAEAPCDPSLVHNTGNGADNAVRYRQRGDRCEGIYAQQVGTVSLEIRSFVESFGPLDLNKGTLLTWQAPPGSSGAVHVRAFSLKPTDYYRMDTSVPADRSSYLWPGDVLDGLRLTADDLGVIAWMELPGPSGRNREVYLPLQGKSAPDGYQVTLFPSASLKEVRVTVSRLDDSGNVTEKLRHDEELRYGYYPSSQPTTFPLGKLGAAGFYQVEIKALDKRGLSAEQHFDFYHPGN
jgi:hypothetical protein